MRRATTNGHTTATSKFDLSLSTPTPNLDLLFAHPLVIAREIGISRRRLDELAARGVGPPRIRVGKRILYNRESVRRWLMEREERKQAR